MRGPEHNLIRIGVDTGGTFTDLLCLDQRGLRVYKLRSVPADPSQAILAGIREVLEGSDPKAAVEITHGSTVATNAVLERKGARVALIATAGFEDVLRIGRQARPQLYNFMVERPSPLVARALTFGLQERLNADGSVLESMRPAELNEIILCLHELQVDSVALCLLHSYANPIHEQQAAKALRAAGFRVSASHEILPEYREFERWSTTAVNAYVAPLMASYLGRLTSGLLELRPRTTLRIMQSNGGSISAAHAAEQAVQTILSGPAAGVVGAQAVGKQSGYTRLITFDMGGTSTDVSLVNETIGTTNESLVGDLPVRLPVLDIHTVGAGGGSVAWIDTGGSLRVGPRSAGAQPGPACFGVGEELTVTDANLLLGRIDAAFFLGGRMSLDVERTRVIAEAFATRLGCTVLALAEGVIRIANANMERALRVVSVERGFDPRDFALLAFGGAGGLHACELAAGLDMKTVLVPAHAGVLSALGMLLADVTKDYSASLLMRLDDLALPDLRERLSLLSARAVADLKQEGFAAHQILMQPAIAMRYKGQAFEIDVPLENAWLETAADAPSFASMAANFHGMHQLRYGYSNPARATEAVQLRLRASGRTHKPSLAPSPTPSLQVESTQPDATRLTVFNGVEQRTPLWHRARLAPGARGAGPALILSGEATTVIPPGWRWLIDDQGLLIATHDADSTKGGDADE